MTTKSPLSTVLSGVLGGLIVLVIGAILIATNVIDTGDTKTVVRQVQTTHPPGTPAATGRRRAPGRGWRTVRTGSSSRTRAWAGGATGSRGASTRTRVARSPPRSRASTRRP